MGYRSGDETYEFEASVEFTTAKARLINPTIGEQVWLPKSQTVEMHPTDTANEKGEQLFTFVVTEWWAKKSGMA